MCTAFYTSIVFKDNLSYSAQRYIHVKDARTWVIYYWKLVLNT